MLKANVKNLLLLTRPYSLTSILTIAILTNVLIQNTLVLDSVLLRDIGLAILVWTGMVYFLEFLHKHIDNRKKIPNIILGLIAIALILLTYRQPLALMTLTAISISVFLYSLKSKDWSLSGVVFIFRGSVEIGIIMMLLILHNVPIIMDTYFYNLIVPIFLITISRNLVGDLRDIDRDKYTFPKRFGQSVTYYLALVLLLSSFFLMPNPLVFFPFLPIIILLIKKKDAYFIHKFYVICTLFFLLIYLIIKMNLNLLPHLLLFIGYILLFTYDLVPRRVEKDLTTIEET